MTTSVLIAIGGNALIKEGETASIDLQQQRSEQIAEQIAALVADGFRVILSHGNGPQVGYIVRRGELVEGVASREDLPPLPLWLAVADSQGGIGHLLSIAIDNALAARGIPAQAVCILTHTVVDRDDDAFQSPSKPIGSVLNDSQAERRRAEGFDLVETSGGHRRVVPSPNPIKILESSLIETLCTTGSVVVAGGGGGIPVAHGPQGWESVDAVVDKDSTSALIAAETGVETLVLVTGVDQVFVGFGTPEQKGLSEVGVDDMARYLAEGEFPAGSMGPKVEAALRFLDTGGQRAVITSIDNILSALQGAGGTRITPQSVKEDT